MPSVTKLWVHSTELCVCLIQIFLIFVQNNFCLSKLKSSFWEILEYLSKPLILCFQANKHELSYLHLWIKKEKPFVNCLWASPVVWLLAKTSTTWKSKDSGPYWNKWPSCCIRSLHFQGIQDSPASCKGIWVLIALEITLGGSKCRIAIVFDMKHPPNHNHDCYQVK